MNWQLVKNVNMPVGVPIELYNKKYNTIRFAIRKTRDTIKFGSDFSEGEISMNCEELDYWAFKEKGGKEVYWSPLILP